MYSCIRLYNPIYSCTTLNKLICAVAGCVCCRHIHASVAKTANKATRPHGVPHGTTRPRPQCHTAQHGHGLSMSHGTWPATRPTRPCHRGLRVDFSLDQSKVPELDSPTENRAENGSGSRHAPTQPLNELHGAAQPILATGETGFKAPHLLLHVTARRRRWRM